MLDPDLAGDAATTRPTCPGPCTATSPARCSAPSASWPRATSSGSTPASPTAATTPTSAAPGSSAPSPPPASRPSTDRWREIHDAVLSVMRAGVHRRRPHRRGHGGVRRRPAVDVALLPRPRARARQRRGALRRHRPRRRLRPAPRPRRRHGAHGRAGRVGRGPQRLPVREHGRRHRRRLREPQRLPLRPRMATEPTPDHPGAPPRAPRAGLRRDGGPRPRRARARAGSPTSATLSGVPILWNAGTRPFGPGCVAVRATREIYLLSTWDEGVPEEIPHDHLYGITWNPMNFVDGAQGHRRRGRPRPRRHRRHVAAVRPAAADGVPRRRDRRRRPGPAGGAPHQDDRGGRRHPRRHRHRRRRAGRGRGRAAARGQRARAHRRVHGRHGVARRDDTGDPGRRAHHLRRRARTADGGAVVRAGDLVAFDAGVVADGYAGEVGRTWPVGARRRRRRRDATCTAGGTRCGTRLLDACQPGAPASGLLDAYGAAGEPLPVLPIGRGLGPRLRRPGDRPRPARDRRRPSGWTPASSSSSPAASSTTRPGRSSRTSRSSSPPTDPRCCRAARSGTPSSAGAHA